MTRLQWAMRAAYLSGLDAALSSQLIAQAMVTEDRAVAMWLASESGRMRGLSFVAMERELEYGP